MIVLWPRVYTHCQQLAGNEGVDWFYVNVYYYCSHYLSIKRMYKYNVKLVMIIVSKYFMGTLVHLNKCKCLIVCVDFVL